MKKKATKKEIVIGEGILQWKKSERVSDRYGTVRLFKDTSCENGVSLTYPPKGQIGTLAATVIEARESHHIGDFFRGIFPVTPQVGQVETLGAGKIFQELGEDGFEDVGVVPVKKRPNDWLSPRALYNIHESVVRLIWVPA